MKRLFPLTVLILPGCGPGTYDECVLEHVKGVSGRHAVGVIINSCRNIFPEKKVAPKAETYLNPYAEQEKMKSIDPWAKQ